MGVPWRTKSGTNVAPAMAAFALAGISPVSGAAIIRTVLTVGRYVQPHILGSIHQSNVVGGDQVGQSQSQSQDSYHQGNVVYWYVEN